MVKDKRLKICCLKIHSKRFKKQRIPYYEKAILPISSYIELKGLKDEYKGKDKLVFGCTKDNISLAGGSGEKRNQKALSVEQK